jgi:D-glycero-alpha-D-manno-heptose 1-phosphate guanylyltransferase
MIDTPLLVLAGGFGTRLRSVVEDVPKPMAPVQGSPFLGHLLENWVGQGARSFVFMLHHKAAAIERFIGEEECAGVLKGCAVRAVTERSPLGTGGAVANAVREAGIEGSFLVANADTWLGAGLAAVASAPVPAMAVVRVGNTERYGGVQIDGSNVTCFAEKNHSGGPGWINAGLYHLDASEFQSWTGDAFSLETAMFPRWAAHGGLRAVPVDAAFVDIGIPDDYFRFRRWAEAGKSGTL